MIEANNPEINIDELKQKITEEVSRRQPDLLAVLQPDRNANGAIAKEVVEIAHIEALASNAEFKAQVRTHWPKKFDRFPFNVGWLKKYSLKVYNFIQKEQRVVNFSLSQGLREVAAIERRLSEQVAELKIQMDSMSDRFSSTEARIAQLSDRLDTSELQLAGIRERLNSVTQEQVTQINATQEQVKQNRERLNASEERVSQNSARIHASEFNLEQFSDRLKFTEEGLNGIGIRISSIDAHLLAIEDRHNRNDSYLKNDLAQQKRLITLFLEEARQRLPGAFSQERLITFFDENQHSLDAFYAAFEERFRGTREDITNKLKVYLPKIAAANVGTPDAPILDVGCGRGEWLELLRDNGYTAKGLDINRVTIEQCQSRGLEAIESDVMTYLRSLPGNSLGAVTGFHIIEHLSFTQLLNLITEVLRVLQPNGIAIFETPNPQNLLVGACDFYSDPTHQRPLYPESMQFLFTYQGLHNVQLLHLNPVETSPFDRDEPEMRILHNWFFGPRDYALIGYKV